MKYSTVTLLASIALLSACTSSDNDDGGANNNGTGLNLVDDTFNAFGNTRLLVGVASAGEIAKSVAGSVLDNDTGAPGSSLTVTGVTPGSGTVNMNPDGSFTYDPLSGQQGSDSFTYEVSDGTQSASAQVQIIFDERIWYVDNIGGGASGTSQDPFTTLSAAELVTEAGDIIYLAGDGSNTGMDQGLSLGVSNIDIIGAGSELLVGGFQLAAAGPVPTISNSAANILEIDNQSNIHVAGVILDAAVTDAIRIDNSSGISLQNLVIQNSGESAIEATGARLGLSLTDVSILNSDTADASQSDDAVFIQASESIVLTMTGGTIDGVPGNLGDGITLLNDDPATVVDMDIRVQGVSFANIGQDAIKLDNENGLVDVLIGGAQLTDANNMSDIGYRGIVIMSDGDPSQMRTNSVTIRNNIIVSTHEGIQLRGIDDIGELTISDNTIDTNANAIVTSAIDIQHDDSADSQARINNNNLIGNSVSSGNGLRIRLFDGASLKVEANNNGLDNFDQGFAFAAREATGLATSMLDATVTDNTLANIALPELAMRTVNYHATAETCLDLRNNTAVSDYAIDVIAGVFNLALNSQAINLTGTITDTPANCQLTSF